ncbi:hypothetical protein TraAM80_02475 [Trypanosoma rangeli]|uniref:Uncharacterized protein n=1 Tax=Trypanosoma rangeli TaxID=5698 RepID=A0A3R7MVU3_TRYRA|nr:uncharacterized protein TraAM80_02475 [Trypanosoma rangeli]RNF08843.1 hypothetical protein TraAM80_02475 [Trypanosoma rangeli]|eukprot:RNF08843.1 hypothetical protein TraAM80_02475 [Trypanosoma rangeli]
MMTPDAGNAMHATSSSVSSYPTYTPPPPLPSRDSVRNTPFTAMRRTFHDECDEVLRLIRADAVTRSASEKSGGTMCVSRSATHEKYRAILDEVEHLNRLLEVTVEERNDLEGELQGKLRQMEAALRERDRELQEKNEELLHLRSLMEDLRTELEAFHRTQHMETPTIHAVARNSSYSNGNDSDAVARRDVGGVPKTGADAASRERIATVVDCLAQSSLEWVKFLLRWCFSMDEGVDGKLAHLLNLLNELEKRGTKPDPDALTVQSLCTQVSKSLMEVTARVSHGRRQLDSNTSDLQTATGHCVSVEQEELQRRFTGLEAERDALWQETNFIAEENVQLLRELKSREVPSSGASSPSANTGSLEVPNSTLMAERKRQADFIHELRLQVKKLEGEKNALHAKFVQQAELLKRYERVLHFLSRHERGDKTNSSGDDGSGSNS